MSSVDTHLCAIYPKSRAYVPTELWHSIAENVDEPNAIPLALSELKQEVALPSFIDDLAQIEWNIHAVSTSSTSIPESVDRYQLNPTLELANLSWKLCELMCEANDRLAYDPDEGDEWAMVWRDPKTNELRIEAASPEDLLIFKVVVREMDVYELTTLANLSADNIHHAMSNAVERGILIAPK